MENATKRIRKARRQGLAARDAQPGRSPRVRTGSPQRLSDIEKAPRPNRSRATRVTKRKAKRQGKAPVAR